MDDQSKKTALRMIPYGLYVLATESDDGRVAAATVNWVTQTAFVPPLLVVGVKKDSGTHDLIKETAHFALSVLGKEQGPVAFAFFKATERDGDRINGHVFRTGATGSPILESAPGYLECRLVETVERGDHSTFVGEVVDAGIAATPPGRPDDLTLTLRDLGDTIFYGG